MVDEFDNKSDNAELKWYHLVVVIIVLYVAMISANILFMVLNSRIDDAIKGN